MIAVAQPVTRPWDGQRFLRFLTGLALLALAFTLRLPTPAEPVTVSPVTAASSVAPVASVAAAAPPADDSSPEPERELPAPALFAVTSLPAGETPRTDGSRAPPAR